MIEKNQLTSFEKEEWKYTDLESFGSERNNSIIATVDKYQTNLKPGTSSTDNQLESFFNPASDDFFNEPVIKHYRATKDNTITYNISENGDYHLAIDDSELLENGAFNQNTLIQVKKSTSAKLFINLSSNTTNAKNTLKIVNQMFHLEQNANLNVNILNPHQKDMTRVINNFSIINHDSNLHISMVNLGCDTEKINFTTRQFGHNCFFEVLCHGVFNKKEKTFINVKAKHYDKHQSCNQLVQNFLQDNSKAIFKGTIDIAENCSDIDSTQLNKNILLSDKASAYSIPGLDVANDQVKCAHGSTTGKIDEEELFYLKSRGINPDVAKKLFILNQLNKDLFDINKDLMIEKINEKIKEII
jgi:Fe-S cluster assembly protein SufD